LKYDGQLQKHNSFLLIPPDGFSPWSHRLLIELRQRLKDFGHSADSLHQVAQQVDGHIEAYAYEVLAMPADIRTLLSDGISIAAARSIEDAQSPHELRRAMPDMDILLANGFGTIQVTDAHPQDMARISFAELAALSLWHMAAAIDAGNSGEDARSMSLMLEAMAAGNMALQVARSGDSMHFHTDFLFGMMGKSVEHQDKVQKLKFSNTRSVAASDGHEKLRGKMKVRAVDLVQGKAFGFYTDAARFVRPIIEAEFKMNAEDLTIIGWLKKGGWTPTKCPDKKMRES
jgi:hypothetical protein